jgi:hypothetical protein
MNHGGVIDKVASYRIKYSSLNISFKLCLTDAIHNEKHSSLLTLTQINALAM